MGKMKLLSHPREKNCIEKLLKDHLRNVAMAMKDELDNTNLNLKLISKQELEKLSFIIGLFHDFGKATTWFQKYIRKEQQSSDFTNHSLVSAVAGYWIAREEFNEKFAYLVFQVIARHHSNLKAYDWSKSDKDLAIPKIQMGNILNNSFLELDDFYKKFFIDISQLKNFDWKDLEDKIEYSDEIVWDIKDMKENAIEFFFINNYLFSLLIDNDKLDAARISNEYFAGNLKEPVNDVFSYLEYCREKEPDKYDPEKPINKLRNSFLNEIRNNEKIKPENHFYSITAPTGIGKTFGCMVFANKLKKQLPEHQGRIIYCLPYTSIIDQNYEEFEKIISFNKTQKYIERPNRYILKHHYQTTKKIINRNTFKENLTLKDYLDDQLLVESWQASIVVTTFVQIMETIIGYRNRFLKKFHNIVNSIVIMDEIQNIDPKYYLLINKVFKILSERFNIYFLQITATQPEIIDKENQVSLVDSKKYMQSELVNRVNLAIDLKEKELDDFLTKFKKDFEDENCLIITNSKKVVKNIYEDLKEQFFGEYQLFCLTTNLIPKDRKKQITEIKTLLKQKQKVIVVATQLVEAGVDFSFKKVYRDLAPFDSIIQAAGRCNRNNELKNKKGEITLINFQTHKRIYPTILIQYVKEILNNKNYQSKDFYELTKRYFENFNFTATSKEILRAIQNMNYDIKKDDETCISDFNLIQKQNTESVYILTDMEAQNKMEELIELKRELQSPVSLHKRDEYRLRIEILKNKLLPYQINTYNLNTYKEHLKPEEAIQYDEDYPYKYLSYEFQKEYAYDNKIGFLKEPKKAISSLLVL